MYHTKQGILWKRDVSGIQPHGKFEKRSNTESEEKDYAREPAWDPKEAQGGQKKAWPKMTWQFSRTNLIIRIS